MTDLVLRLLITRDGSSIRVDGKVHEPLSEEELLMIVTTLTRLAVGAAKVRQKTKIAEAAGTKLPSTPFEGTLTPLPAVDAEVVPKAPDPPVINGGMYG